MLAAGGCAVERCHRIDDRNLLRRKAGSRGWRATGRLELVCQLGERDVPSVGVDHLVDDPAGMTTQRPANSRGRRRIDGADHPQVVERQLDQGHAARVVESLQPDRPRVAGKEALRRRDHDRSLREHAEELADVGVRRHGVQQDQRVQLAQQPAQLGRPELDRDLRLVEGLDDLLGDVLPPFAARVDERNPAAKPGAGPLGEMLEEDALADAIGPEGGHGTSRGEGLASNGDLRVAPDKVRKIAAGRVHRPRERLVLDLRARRVRARRDHRR